MKRWSTFLMILALLAPVASNAEPCGKGDADCIIFARGGSPYGWTISASLTDPFDNTSTATASIATYYLWFLCSDYSQGGMAAAEFDLAATGAIVLATTPVNGFLNAGGPTNLLLAVGGCPVGPVVAANVLTLSFPGSICLAPSAQNGNKGTVDCSLAPQLWPIDWRGLELVPPVSVDQSTWGSVKQRYR